MMASRSCHHRGAAAVYVVVSAQQWPYEHHLHIQRYTLLLVVLLQRHTTDTGGVRSVLPLLPPPKQVCRPFWLQVAVRTCVGAGIFLRNTNSCLLSPHVSPCALNDGMGRQAQAARSRPVKCALSLARIALALRSCSVVESTFRCWSADWHKTRDKEGNFQENSWLSLAVTRRHPDLITPARAPSSCVEDRSRFRDEIRAATDSSPPARVLIKNIACSSNGVIFRGICSLIASGKARHGRIIISGKMVQPGRPGGWGASSPGQPFPELAEREHPGVPERTGGRALPKRYLPLTLLLLSWGRSYRHCCRLLFQSE